MMAAWDQRQRFYMAANVPFEVAVMAFGSQPNLNNDTERAAFMAVWAMLRVELGDAMLRQLGYEVPRDG